MVEDQERHESCTLVSQGVSGMKGFGIHLGSTLCFDTVPCTVSVPSMSCVSFSERHTDSVYVTSSNLKHFSLFKYYITGLSIPPSGSFPPWCFISVLTSTHLFSILTLPFFPPISLKYPTHTRRTPFCCFVH